MTFILLACFKIILLKVFIKRQSICRVQTFDQVLLFIKSWKTLRFFVQGKEPFLFIRLNCMLKHLLCWLLFYSHFIKLTYLRLERERPKALKTDKNWPIYILLHAAENHVGFSVHEWNLFNAITVNFVLQLFAVTFKQGVD